MKYFFFLLCVLSIQPLHVVAQKTSIAKSSNTFPDYSSVFILEEHADTTANMSFGDFDGDGHLDILLVKGRHWPIVDRVFLGDGMGGVRKSYNLSEISDRSYTGALADFNGDGSVDIALSNDSPDKKVVYFNDGKGNFTVGSEFGIPKWPTRNLSVADINADELPDLILANRGRNPTSNYICLNLGQGKFTSDCIAFANYPSTTITPADINKDGFIDLVVPHRDGGQSYVYLGNAYRNYSDTRRILFGPSDASIRTAYVADFNGDQIPDVVGIDENKGLLLFYGQKDQIFSAGISLFESLIVPYALSIADLNNDGRMDIIVGYVFAPSKIFYNNGTDSNFKSISFGDSNGTVYGFAVGDFNEDGIPDIATARSEATNMLHFGKIK